MNKELLKSIINIFEMGVPYIKYDAIYVYNDGPGNITQYTLSFGITQYGNMESLINLYINKNGKYSNEFKKYVGKIKTRALTNDESFKSLLKNSSKNDKVMRDCQDIIYDRMYWNPAYNWFQKNGFKETLSLLVIFDSFVHSGSILDFLRNRFAERPPASGGNEKKWIEQYLIARRAWLANHSRTILRKTTYRCDFMLGELKNNNWQLSCPLRAHGVKVC